MNQTSKILKTANLNIFIRLAVFYLQIVMNYIKLVINLKNKDKVIENEKENYDIIFVYDDGGVSLWYGLK